MELATFCCVLGTGILCDPPLRRGLGRQDGLNSLLPSDICRESPHEFRVYLIIGKPKTLGTTRETWSTSGHCAEDALWQQLCGDFVGHDPLWPESAARFRVCWYVVMQALDVPCQDISEVPSTSVCGGGATAMCEATHDVGKVLSRSVGFYQHPKYSCIIRKQRVSNNMPLRLGPRVGMLKKIWTRTSDTQDNNQDFYVIAPQFKKKQNIISALLVPHESQSLL